MRRKMQYLVSLPDETIEQVIQLEKEWGLERNEVIRLAVKYTYNDNFKPEKPSRETKTVYRIFEGRSGNQLTAKNILEDEIRANLATGWTLYGSPFCVGGTFGVMRGDMWTYSQAMIKEE